ncbi:MAG: type II toxin-antitoxin system PemK/MazF family toxin [Acidimicrobiia bacterium]|nr:type II toxin-antitoxin system PemK/MazF family toxin [Acidimicrobiia bacterium]
MSPGEICLASFPFGDTAGMKLRPVLVPSGPIGPIPEVLVAYISSVLPAELMPSDLVLDPAKPEFRSTNLKTTSVLRLHKLATIHASMIARHLGDLPGSQKKTVSAKLHHLLASW